MINKHHTVGVLQLPLVKLGCTTCSQAKHVPQNFKTRFAMFKKQIDLIHTYMCQPFPTPTFQGHFYFMMTFVDDHT